MRSVRSFAVMVATIAALGLSEVHATRPASADDAELSAAPQDSSTVFVVPRPTAVETLVAVAQTGNVEAMNLLGVLYTTGTEVPRDTAMALYWFQKAIDGGSADAMDNLATMYLAGIGLSRDPVNALRWFKRSAARGNVHASYSVAVMAEKGLGTGRDLPLARAMYRRAAESGFTPAMIRISEDYAHGWGTKRDPVEAYAWLQVALQSGLPEELQIAAFASMNELETRLAPQGRDEARERATRIVARIKLRALPPGPKPSAAMQVSSL